MQVLQRILSIGMCLTLLLNPLAFAQPTPPVEAPAVDKTVIKDGLVSLDFQEADIRNVLKVLAFKTGINIVPGPEVTGIVTIQLKDVPWQKALDVILSTYGFGFEQKGNIIKVMSIENLKKYREDKVALEGQEPLITKTFILNYAKASEVIDSLAKMKTERGSVNFDQRTNTIIVRDVLANIDLISEVIKSLDSVTPQVLIEAKIVETNVDNNENLGVNWVLKGGVSGSRRATAFPFAPSDGNRYMPSMPNAPSEVNEAGSLFSYGTLDASQMSATLELLNSRTDTNILSNPRIVTLDNQTASIIVGEQYPIPQYTYNEEQAKLQVSGWEYKDIGIIFEVTPHVNNAGLVTLDLQPKVTAITTFVTVENTSLPRLSTEEAKTKVMVRDGDTLVIAGLIKEKTTDTKTKVPFFGDIPLIGAAFRKKEAGKQKTELLIFLTPHIITAKQIQQASEPAPSTK